MPPLTITAAQVLPGTGAIIVRYTAGVAQTITAGQAVYDQGSFVAGLADCDAGSGAHACVGIALNAASPGQPVNILQRGPITLGAGAAPVNGTPYFLSPIAGGIAPLADILTGDRLVYLGCGIGTNQVNIQIHLTAATVQ